MSGTILGNVAEGAISGAAGGPIGMGLGALSALVPSIAHLFFGNNKAVNQAASIIQSAAGTLDPGGISAWAMANPAQAAQLQVQMATLAAQTQKDTADAAQAQLDAQLKDVQSARAQTTNLAAAHSLLAWGAGVISALVIAGFVAICWLVFTRAIPTGAEEIVYNLQGTMGAAFISVVSYWVGSSSGSNMKSVQIEGMTPSKPSTATK